jgi:predicted RNA-binding protein with PUA-like domain
MRASRASVSYWLLKSEPDVFSIDALAASPRKTTCWDGVRNYQARNFLRAMRVGDRAFFYHSNCAEPGIAGIVEIVRAAYPDATAFDRRDPRYDPNSDRQDPTWFMVDVKLERKLERLISLTELKAHANKALSGLLLLRRGNRLSVLPVDQHHWNYIVALE